MCFLSNIGVVGCCRMLFLPFVRLLFVAPCLLLLVCCRLLLLSIVGAMVACICGLLL